MQVHLYIRRLALLLLAAPLFYASAQESSFFSNVGGVLGSSLSIGTLGDSGMDLKNRTMAAATIHGLVGYRVGKFLPGIDVNYRWQFQLTSLDSAGGTNLKGKGFLFGIGSVYQFNERFSLLGAIDFLGGHHFEKNTAGFQDDELRQPLILRVSGNYFFWPSVPLSIDGGLEYARYGVFHVGGVNHSEAASEYLLSLGISYFFGGSHTAQ